MGEEGEGGGEEGGREGGRGGRREGEKKGGRGERGREGRMEGRMEGGEEEGRGGRRKWSMHVHTPSLFALTSQPLGIPLTAPWYTPHTHLPTSHTCTQAMWEEKNGLVSTACADFRTRQYVIIKNCVRIDIHSYLHSIVA